MQPLRVTGVVLLVALGVHGLDHARRGIDVISTHVLVAGTLQFVAASVAVFLVFRGHRSAALAASLVGIPGAVGFAAAHILPHWGAFSDPFTGAERGVHVSALSWFTALFEIGADLAFGFAGLAALRGRDYPFGRVRVTTTSA